MYHAGIMPGLSSYSIISETPELFFFTENHHPLADVCNSAAE